MNVYAVMHDDWGVCDFRGVYATREEAEAAASGTTVEPWGKTQHFRGSGACCTIAECELEIGWLSDLIAAAERTIDADVDGNSGPLQAALERVPR